MQQYNPTPNGLRRNTRIEQGLAIEIHNITGAFMKTNNKTESVIREYNLPSPTLLDNHSDESCEQDENYLREAGLEIEKTLESFGICGYVSAITVGPRITRYEIALNPGVRADKFLKIETNFALALKTQSIRLVIPIPGKNAVGIEVPNKVSLLRRGSYPGLKRKGRALSRSSRPVAAAAR